MRHTNSLGQTRRGIHNTTPLNSLLPKYLGQTPPEGASKTLIILKTLKFSILVKEERTMPSINKIRLMIRKISHIEALQMIQKPLEKRRSLPIFSSFSKFVKCLIGDGSLQILIFGKIVGCDRPFCFRCWSF